MKKMIIIAGIIILLGIGVWFLLPGNNPPTSSQVPSDATGSAPAPAPESVAVPPAGSSVNSGATAEIPAATKEFTVTGANFSFTPSTLTVEKGDRVKIIFKNSGGSHDFRIDEFNVATKRIQGGAEDTVEFTADKSGTFEYYCSVGSHRAMGMKGTLIVQ